GATVAMVGRLGEDEAALSAADVAIVLEAAGSAVGDWSVTLASDDVRDAADGLVAARRARLHARAAMFLGLAPGVASALAIAFGLLPPAFAPLAVLVSAVGTHLHLRAVAPSQHDDTSG
ncbi:MAG TPA: hypothetical protein PLV85_03890, partial [Polyangiaceae bacterium]|nr:hypothetical protein [Polyangiaceae bacterium]